MGRAPCCDKAKVNRGPWSPEEDSVLRSYLEKHGTAGNWIALPSKAGLNRCGKSCRLRWLNYLRPDIKLGGFTDEEENIILALYSSIGSRWSVIASHLPGRTDNDIKNYWNTKLKKKLSTGKVSVNNSNDNNDIIAKDVSQSHVNSTQISASSSIVEVETFDSGNSTYLHGITSSCTWPYVMDNISYQQNVETQGIASEPFSQVAFPGPMEVNSDYSTSASNNYNSMSSSVQDQVSSLSISYSANVEEGSLLGFGFESSYQLLNEFDFDRATGGVAPDLADYYPFTN